MTSYIWDVTSGNFGAASSWSPSGTPTSSDPTSIDTTTSLFGSGSALFLNIYNTITVTVTATLTTTIADDVLIGGGVGQSPAVVDVDAAWSDSSEISVGQDGVGTGELFVNSGGSLNTAYLNIGTNFSNETPDYTGSMTVQGGGVVNTTGGYDEVGVWQGGTGTLTVTGSGSSWTSSGNLNIGDNGTGTLYVENDATLNAVYLDTGVSYDQPTIASGSGTTYIESGGVVTTTGEYQEIGDVDTNASSFATEAATGAVTVTGAGSKWNAENGQISIGDAGSKSGSLTISNDGEVVSGGEFYIGDEWDGADGSYGTLTIESGGTAVTGGAWSVLGATNAGQPTSTALVTGADSSWTVDELIINGSGELQATSGGTVHVQSALGLQGGTLQVDSDSTLEDGDAGGAALGYLTVDPDPNYDSNLWAEGTIEADVIDNGKIYSNEFDGQGSLVIEGPTAVADTGTLTGSGYLYIGTQSPLDLAVASVASTLHVQFAGWDTALEIEATGFSAPIKNFNAGDAIDIQGLSYDNSASSYTFTPDGPDGAGTLVITEGASSVTLDIASSLQTISGNLTLSSYAGGSGTAVSFTNGAAQSPFNLWSTLGSFFNTSNGTVDGEDYGLSDSADGGTPIWMETETPASSYVSGAPDNYTTVLATQDWLGDIQPEITIATDNDFVDPFVNNVLGAGNLAGATIFSNTATTGTGGIVYWTASTTTGDYAVDFEPFTVSYPSSPSTSNLVTITGSPVTMISAIANPLSWTFGVDTSTSLVFAYMTQDTGTTENLYMEGFDANGAATNSAPVLIASGLPDGTPYYVGESTENNQFSGYGYRYLEIGGSLGTGLVAGTFNTTTGASGAPTLFLSLPDYTSFDGIYSHLLSTGNTIRLVEGVEDGQAVIQSFINDSTAAATFDLSSASDHFAATNVYDPNTAALDYIVLAYVDAGEVHLELLNETGGQIGADVVVPGISSFLRLNTMQGNTVQSSTRVELDYEVADPNGGQEIKGFIFDTDPTPYNVTLNGGGLYDGSPFDDTFNWAAGDYTIGGGGGVDTFVVPLNADLTALSLDPSGDVVVQTYADSTLTISTGSTTLVGFTYVQMNGSTITISQTANGEDLTISAGGLLQLAGATPANDAIAFNPAGGELAIEGGGSLGGTIDGFTALDKIDLAGLRYDASASSYSVAEVGTTDIYDVTVNEGSSSFALQFEQSTPLTNTELSLNPDSGTGTQLVETVATWTGAVSNDWSNGANWTPAGVPGVGDTIVIPASAAVPNEPSILDNGAATVSGDIEDNGVITLASTGDRTDLIINGGVTLSGSGSLTLTDSSANQIYSNQGGSILTNEATIQGAGEIISNSNLSIVNDGDGVIDASQKNNVLNIDNITVTNDGLVESTGAAGLYLQSVTLNQTDGGVLEANGGPININGNVDIIGGTIEDGPNGGLIHSSNGGSLLDGAAADSPLTIASKTIVQIDNDANLSLAGSIVNDGEISLASAGDSTDLIVGSGATGGTVTLSGGGTVQLGDNNANRIYSNTGSTTLDNVDDTIQGAGQIFSNGNLGILNEAKGVIDGASSTSGNELRLTSISITNEGLLEGTGAGGLELDNMTLNQAGGGVLEADDGVVTIGGGADIVGGALTSANGGTLQSDAGGSLLDGTGAAVTITAGTTLKIDNNESIALASNGTTGSIVNKGEILLDANTDTTVLIVGSGAAGGTVALSGGGALQLSDSDVNEIYSNTGSTTLDNIDNKIQGAGVIESNGNLGVTNEADGIIDGTSSTAGHDLRLTDIAVTNKGLVEGTGSGGLELDNMTLTQTNGGVLEADGGAVTLGSYTHIIGGTLTSVNGGTLKSDGVNSQLDGASQPITISSGTDVEIEDNTNLYLSTNNGPTSFTNDGEISLDSSGDNTDLIIGTGSGSTAGTLTLSGGGTVQLSDSSANRIYSNTGSTTLYNLNNTIEGAGQILSNSNLGLVNAAAGVIDATGTNNVLNVNSITVTNNGLIESTGAAGLLLQAMTLNQTGGGVLEADGGPINISGNVHIIGGAIEDGAGGGLIHSSSTGSLLDGTTTGEPLTIGNGTTVQIDNNENLAIAGEVVDNGEISLASTGDSTDLIVGSGAAGGTVTLSGGGTVQLSDSSANRIYSTTGSTTLDNVDDTIEGGGQIFSNGNLGIVNEAKGVIDATGETNVLNINSITVANDDLVESTGAAGLLLQGMTLNQTDGGVLEADGGPINIGASVHIIGGAIEDGVNGGLIHSSNVGSLLDGTGQPVTIAKGTTVQIDDAANLSIVGKIVNNGEIALASSGDLTDLIVGSGAAGATVTLSGGGTVQLGDNNAGRIYSNTSSTTLDNIDDTIEGAGQIFSNSNLAITNEANGVIDGASSASGEALRIDSITLTNDGLLEGTGSVGLEIDSMTLNQSGGGLLEADAGTVSIGSDADIVGGTLTSVSSGLLQSNGAGSQLDGTSAAVTITSGTTLQVDNNTNLSLTTNGGVGTIIDKGSISLNSTGDSTDLLVGAGSTHGSLDLTGGGVIQLSDSADNRIYSNTGSTTLDNDDTIEGAGQIFSNSNLSIVNETAGVVAATFADTPLAVSSMSFDNLGTAEAENGATLSFTSALTNISADPNHAGGSVLTGGTYDMIDQASGSVYPASTIAISGNGAEQIATLAATVDLAGLSSEITSNGVSLADSLLEVADDGDLNLYYGAGDGYSQNFTDPNAVTIDKGGQVSVTGASFSTAGLTIASGGYLLATGGFDSYDSFLENASVEGPIVNDGLITAAGVEAATADSAASQPVSSFSGPISGNGAIDVDQDALAEFGGAVGLGQTIYFDNDQVLSATQVAGEETIKIDTLTVDPNGSGTDDFAATIANFNLGDAIDLTNFDDETDYSFDGSTLTVDFANDQTASLTLAGDTATTFHFSSDGDGGTLITIGAGAQLAHDTGVSATDGVTNDPSLTGTANSGAILTFTEGDTTLGTTVVGANGLWNFTPTGLADGVQTIAVSEESGNNSVQVASVTFALATQAPSATVSQTLSGLTNKTTDVISGVATAEDVAGDGIASVEIIDLDDDVTRSATLGADGSYSANLTGLSDGGHEFEVIATDIAGNFSPVLLTGPIIATQAPTVTASESVSGTTTATDDFISATAAPENPAYNSIASVIVYDGQNKLGAATYEEGTWTFAADDLALGEHDFSLVTTDAAGNSTTTTLAPVDVVSGVNPTVSASISAPGLTNQASETVTETATAGDGNTIVGVEVFDGSRDLGAASFNSDTQTWSFTATGLADGEHDFSTVTTDSGDNHTTTDLPVVEVATVAPINGSPSESVSGITNQTSETISVTPTVEDIAGNGVASVEILDTLGPTTAATLGAGGVYSATLTDLSDGAHMFDVVTTDIAGNSTTTTLAEVDIATQAPAMVASESVSGTTTQTSDVLSATVTAEEVPGDSIASVVAFDGETELGAATLSNGVWSYTASDLSLGDHTFSLVATDAAGNSTTKTLAPVDVVSAAAPTVNALISTPGLTNQTSETISETATASAGNTITGVEVFDNSKELGAASFNSDTQSWSFTASNLADGPNVFLTVTTDSASNHTTTTLPTVDIATQAPVNGSPSERVSGITNTTSETISVTPTVESVPGNGVASVEIVDTSTDTTTAATLGAGGVYSATLTGLTDGAHVFDVVTTDIAGNSTTTSLAEVDIATQAPAMIASESVSGTTTQTSDVLSATVTAEEVPGDSIASVVAFDGETELGAATLSNGVWGFTASDLSLGGHTFSLVATDAAGNSTTKTLASVDVVSGANPTVNASISTPGLTNQTSETITETATASAGNTIAGVEVLDNGVVLGAASFNSDTQTWSFTATGLADNANNFSTVTTDSGDNRTTTALPVVDIATEAPVNGSASESVSGITNKTSETISVAPSVENVAGNGVASVDIVDTSTNITTAATLGAGGVYSATLTGLGDGAHVFDIVTTDNAGNSTTTALAAVDIATQAPVNSSPSESVSGLTNKTSETISVTPSVENVPGNGVASVEIIDSSSNTTTAATLGAGGVYSATLTGLSDGAHVFDVVTTDNAGNSTTTALSAVDIATQAPTVNASESVSGTTTLTSDVITATAAAEQVSNNSIASVVVYDGDTELGPATFSEGTWSYTASDLTPGAYDFSLVTTDTAGSSTTTKLAPVNVVLPLTVSADESVSGLTDLTSDTISETATTAPGLTITGVEVFDGDTDLGAATYEAATGLWSFTAQNLSDGAHDLSTLTSDSAGDTWLATLPAVDVATAPPTVTASQSLSGLTNENQDTITETATAEAVGANAIESVEIYDGAVDLGAAAFSGGAWTFNTAMLPDGAHHITTVTTDTAGNQTTTTLPIIHVATNLPRVKASESASGLTNQNSITVTETAIAEQVAFNSIESVEVYDGATALGAATLSGGVWTFTTPTLADGVHDLSTVTADAAGNTATKALAPVDVATAPPIVTASQSFGLLTNQDQDTITEAAVAEAVGANAVESVGVYDGATDLGAASLSAGIWTFTTGILSDGAHHLATVTTDEAGNQTTTELPVTHVGTNPPRVKVSESVSGLTNQSSVTITETAMAEQVAFNAIESVEVYDGATALGAATLSGGVWSFTTPTLTDGVHNLSTVTIDAAGNTTTKTLAAVDVATAPPATTVSQSLGRLTNQDQDTITEIATAEAVGANVIEAVEVYDGAVALGAAAQSGGAWTFTTGILADGAHQLMTVTTDAAGNQTTTALSVIHVGTMPPRVKASESASGLTNQSSVTVSETAIAEAVAFNAIQSVEVYDGGAALGAATLSGGVWTFTTPTLADGVHSLSTVTTDAAGNTTTKTLAAVDVATAAPIVSAFQSVSGLTSETQDTIAETATAEAIGSNAIVSVNVFDGSTALGAATFSAGAWTFTTPTLTDGVHVLSTVTTDAAGNATTTLLAPINVEPPAANVSIALVDDTSDGLDITSDDAISGGGDPGAIVQFTIDGSPITQTATADRDGNWTFTPSNLSEGPHTIVASETNGGGTGSATLSFTYLATPPSVSISTPSGTVAFPSELIDGAGEAGTTVQLFDGSQELGGPVDVGANGIWNDTVTLTGAGAHTITAADTDAANNVTVSSAITLFLDNQIVGQSNQTQVSATTGDDHIIVDAANATVNALGGDNTVSLTSAGGATQFHLINGGGGSNTLDLSGTSGGAVVNLGLQMATGPEIGTNDVFNFQNIIGGAGPETLTLNTAPGGGTGPAGGGAGAPTQGATSGGGFIEAGSGDDIMTGGPGDDAFIFLSTFGNDTITNFNVSGSTHDVFEVSQSLFANWSAIDGALTDTAAGAELVLNPAETVTFTGVTKAALEANSSADFRFV